MHTPSGSHEGRQIEYNREVSAAGSPTKHARLRVVWTFVLAATILLLTAGRSAFAPSANAHYLEVAAGWLDGRLALEGDPPGYCSTEARRAGRCRHHQHDDWAQVWTLKLADGQIVRGQPCVRDECRAVRREGKEAWLDVTGRRLDLERSQIVERSSTWYVSFPPGPAALLLPFVALWGLATWDVLLTLLAAALIPALIVGRLDRSRGVRSEHLWLAAAWTFATPAWFVGAHGSVWFTAQIFGALGSWIYILHADEDGAELRAGTGLALAMACRPHLAFAALYFVTMRGLSTARAPALVRFGIPLVVVGSMMAALNYARFDQIFEFGHRYLDVRWQHRMQTYGQFSLHYLARNLQCAFALLPQLRGGWPPLAVSIHGSAVWLGSPWLLASLRPRTTDAGTSSDWSRRRALALAATIVVLAVPALVYHNSGQLQFSYRFALDWLPYAACALLWSGRATGRAWRALILVGALYQAMGAWYFARDPGRVFVADPLGWPFEDEMKNPRG